MSIKLVSDTHRVFEEQAADEGVGDLLARLADEVSRGTQSEVHRHLIEIERIGHRTHVRVRRWGES